MDRQQVDLLRSALGACRALVAAFGNSGARACPSLGADFQQNLLALAAQLSVDAGPERVDETERKIEQEVDIWGTRAAEYYKQKADEIREIMLTMTEAARAVGDRDQQYKDKFGAVTERLHTIDNLEDITQIRALVNQSATELRSCVDRMVVDGEQSIASLKAQLTKYEERLHEAELLSWTDPLTGLTNRVGLEHELKKRVRGARPFCVLVVDLNGFKALNDTHGHLAGDALLKAFSDELRSQFRPLDTVARWGGDEFAAALDCGIPEAQALIERIRKWAFGEYTIPIGGKPVKIAVSAAIGLAAWQSGQTIEQVFAVADKAMYVDKGSKRRTT
jgi:diguanylate cyclase (GGDEF)-like protein